MEQARSNTDRVRDILNLYENMKGRIFTAPGDKWQFLFDYGDDHRFIVEVLGFGEAETGTRYPRVLARKGKPPPQYPPEDDGDYDEED